MREIKFRAWHPDDDKMYYFNSLDVFTEIGLFIGGDTVYRDTNGHKEGGVVWLQYTGLKDKNGKEIYEGDIVEREEGRCEDIEIAKYHVCYSSPTFRLITVQSAIFRDGAPVNMVGELEVIGNIYENPELL